MGKENKNSINFWKLGSNWEKYKYSFFEILKKNNIVISYDPKGTYKVGDFVLITEKFNVIAIAKVIEKKNAIMNQIALVNELKSFKVTGFDKISFYKAEILELPEELQFEYKLQ